MLVCVFCFPWHTRPRVQRASGFPCALSVFCEGGEFAKPGRTAPRQCGSASSLSDGQKPDESESNPDPSAVIASEAKQSIGQHAAPWIASSQVLLAMTVDVFSGLLARPAGVPLLRQRWHNESRERQASWHRNA